MNCRSLHLLMLLALAGCSAAPADERQTRDSTTPVEGPALQLPPEQLDAALSCSGELAGAMREVVLITPAFTDDRDSFGWNYLRQLPALGIPTCSLSIPGRGFGDLQEAAEYVVHAVRKIHAQSGRQLILLGHQHGPLDELWALKFWPDLAPMVASYVSLATPHQGTAAARQACDFARRCAPAVWQIAAGSNFLAALAAQPLPSGIGYTSIATQFDEVIVPQPAASRMEGAANIVLQDLCPGRPIEHFTILADHLSYSLVLDAIEHPGAPADPQRLPEGICSGPLYMPGVISPRSSGWSSRAACRRSRSCATTPAESSCRGSRG